MRADAPDGLRLPDRLAALAAGLRCTPAEACALAVLVAGALVALLLLWRLAVPPAPPSAAPLGEWSAEEGAGELAATEPLTVVTEEIVVHVAGLVAVPGLYRLAGGARVADALEAAGGPLPEAALEAVNLARPLTDGEQLLVPAAGPPAEGSAPGEGGGAATPPAHRPDGTLDLNHATQADLEELPGIGPVMAQRILEHREQTGRFQAVGDLRDVPGIGEKTFQKLAPLVGV
jgi:competence protein ComEA